jgi:hypothetical protein
MRIAYEPTEYQVLHNSAAAKSGTALEKKPVQRCMYGVEKNGHIASEIATRPTVLSLDVCWDSLVIWDKTNVTER